MALDRNFVSQFAKFPREQIQQFFTILIWSRTAEIKKRAGCRFQKLNPQSFRRDCDFNLIFEFVEVWHVADRLLEFLLELRHVVFRDYDLRSWPGGAGSKFACSACRISEISRDRFAHRLAGVEQPKNDEQCHHCGHEISVSNFPGAAVVGRMSRLLFDNNDWPSFVQRLILRSKQLRRLALQVLRSPNRLHGKPALVR